MAGAFWSEADRAFDISNISGFENVGSMVVYEKGKPKRSDYRKFRIETVAGRTITLHAGGADEAFPARLNESKELEEKQLSESYGEISRGFRIFCSWTAAGGRSISRSRCWTSCI